MPSIYALICLRRELNNKRKMCYTTVLLRKKLLYKKYRVLCYLSNKRKKEKKSNEILIHLKFVSFNFDYIIFY